jgi:adenine-specific DNA-methyltransferase
VIQKLKEENPLFAEQGQDLGFKVFKLKHSNFKLWRGDGIKDSDQLEEQLDLLADPVREAALEENLLTELLLKSGFELTTPVEKKTVGETHYWLAKDEEGNSLAVALQSIDETLLREMITQEPQQVICLDRLFTSDQLKTNIQLQCKDAGIVFHSI